MTILDTYLNNMAKASVGESFETPAYIVASTDSAVTNISTTQTSISGEAGSRILASVSRTNNNFTMSGIRSGATVINTTDGDDLSAVALLSESSGGELHFADVVSGIVQTTAFDVEFVYDIGFTRG